MKNKRLSFPAVLLACVMPMAHSTPSQSPQTKKEKQAVKLQAQAKISMDAARTIALKKAPGEVKEGELEKEHGKLVYSFDIQEAGDPDITEVQVSAIDGSIVSVEKESAASQAKEKREDEAKAKKTASQKTQKPPQQ
ncbi:MAG TPA: PepSY domain-containing protein [Candidatus Dormibacteraeota bacterium]|nr:PepSY domain-containing protein [Candidatus Dormibacteraeota bacterium]